jgi:hypothetical protein
MDKKLIKEICIVIGCSGVSPQLCNDKPEDCQIIRKFIRHINGSPSGRVVSSQTSKRTDSTDEGMKSNE